MLVRRDTCLSSLEPEAIPSFINRALASWWQFRKKHVSRSRDESAYTRPTRPPRKLYTHCYLLSLSLNPQTPLFGGQDAALQMLKAGVKRSLWAPLSSSSSCSSAATTPADSHPPADKPETSSRRAKTLEPPDEPSPADEQSGHWSPKRDHLYRRSSERWGRSYDSESSWKEGEDEDEDEDQNQNEDCGLLGDVPYRYKMASWSGQPGIKGRTEWVRMMLLCAVHFGITFTWGVEMTYCTPYLLNLGLTKSQTSLVWIAGPLSGLITQPIVGALADSSRSRWGRRRPYIVVGSVIVAGGLMTLGWTKELVSLVMPTDTDFAKMLIIFLAVLALYVTDFAINAGT